MKHGARKKESDMVILRRTEKSLVTAMLVLGLNGTTDKLAMANSVRWAGHVLRREDGDVLRRALDLEVEG